MRAPDDLTPEILTDLLRQAGALARGQVERIERQPVTPVPFGSAHQLFHLAVQYRGAESEQPPERLFLKFGKSRKECFFYTEIAPALKLPALLRCYYAEYDSQADQTCLLLEDLSVSHFQTEWPVPPPDRLCFQTVERLAEIHARGWEDACLERDFRPTIPAGRSWSDRMALAVEKLPDFLDFLGDRLSPRRRVFFERILASGRAWEAASGAPGRTLTHGDMHFWNVLYPRDPARDSLRLFDWNMWDIGRGTDDLAYLLALHWYPERRDRLESAMLFHYLDHLHECGITGYTESVLWRDYRISTIRSLFIPVWQWARGTHPSVWWPHLERGLLAFEDLNCNEVIA